MVKPLTFKGDKKSKKRKRPDAVSDSTSAPTSALTTTDTTAQASTNAIDDDTTWVTADQPSDISGPILLVLPSTPPSALSSDATGSIFASPLHNLVDGHASTAEPHDVRQVWVATRTAGSDKLSLKGSHGRYLACDASGVLSATREAAGLEEGFEIVPAEGFGEGWMAVRNARGKYVGVEQGKEGQIRVRADVEEVDASVAMRVRMQAKFKPRLKVAKEKKAREKISRLELEEMAGRRLEEEEVKRLKRARREGGFQEAMLDVRVKGKHDRYTV